MCGELHAVLASIKCETEEAEVFYFFNFQHFFSPGVRRLLIALDFTADCTADFEFTTELECGCEVRRRRPPS